MSRRMTEPTKWHVRPARLRSAWASAQSDQSSLSPWRKLGSLASHWAHSEDSGQTGRIPKLIWIFTGRTSILLVLSWGGSYIDGTFVCAVIETRGNAFFPLKLTYFRQNFAGSLWQNFCRVDSFEPRHEKICLCHTRTTKVRSLISAFVVRCLDSLISVTAQTGLSLPPSQTPKTGFLVTGIICFTRLVPTEITKENLCKRLSQINSSYKS